MHAAASIRLSIFSFRGEGRLSKKTFSILFITLFVFLSICPVAGILVFGQSKAVANEVQTRPPKLFRGDGSFNTSVTKDITDYVADHFAFRNQLINAWAELNSTVFRISAEEQVILGTDGWLYYSSTADDYMGRGLGDAELRLIARNLSLIQEYAEKCGAEFFFTIAPNKNSLYPEHMPAFIPRAQDASNASRIRPMLDEYGVRYIDLFAPFSDENEILYYQTDSHWTDRGAALAADILLSEMKKDTSFFTSTFSPGDPHRGDLYDMLYPTGKKAEMAQCYAPGFSFALDGNADGGNALTLHTLNGEKTGKLLCWRDSFGVSLYPYLADSFSESFFYREAAYHLTRMESMHSDTVLIELVERNLDWLLSYVPVFPAPQRQISLDLAVSSEQIISAATRPDKESGLICVSGEIPEDRIPDSVYVRAGDCLYEAYLTKKDGKWAFHAYLEEGSEANGLYLACQNELVFYPVEEQ